MSGARAIVVSDHDSDGGGFSQRWPGRGPYEVDFIKGQVYASDGSLLGPLEPPPRPPTTKRP